MAVRKIKGSWWVDFHFGHERLRKRSPLNSKGGAEAYEVQLRQLVATHGTVPKALQALTPKAPVVLVTFAEFAAQWMRDYVAVNNKSSEQYTKHIVLRSHLLPVFGRLSLAEITVAEIDRFKGRAIAAGLKAKSVNNYVTILRTCLATAVEWGLLVALPRIHLLKAPMPGFRYLSEGELAALEAAADGVWRDLIVFAARTGLRISELIALEWPDIDLVNRLVTVRRGCVRGHLDSPKNYRIRHVPLTTEVVAILAPHQSTGGLVFTHQGRPVSPKTAHVHLHTICRRANLAPHGWHVFRHTFASLLAQRGASLQALKELLGHSSLTMVLRYAHLAPSYLAETIRLLEAPAPARLWATGCQPEHSERLPALSLIASEAPHSWLNPASKDHACA